MTGMLFGEILLKECKLPLRTSIKIFWGLLGSKDAQFKLRYEIIAHDPVLTDEMKDLLSLNILDEETKNVLFAILGTKAPGLDVFNNTFLGSAGISLVMNFVEISWRYFLLARCLERLTAPGSL